MACMKSFMRHGHQVVLHCYDRPEDLPSDVDVFDAAKVMPRGEVLRHKSGSLALGSDRYRYLMIEAGHGLYADCDMFCVGRIDDADYVFGKEHDAIINCAILHFPPGSELSKMLVELTSSRFNIPPFIPKSRQRSMRLKHLFGVRQSVETMEWGVWGPALLTYAIDVLGLRKFAAPYDVYYPLHWGRTELLYDPDLRLEDFMTHRTKAIHLTDSNRTEQCPKGSVLDWMMNGNW